MQAFVNLKVALARSSELRQADITLYAIGTLGMADAGGVRVIYYKHFLKGLTSPSRAEFGNLALQVLAVQSGGRVISGSNDLSSTIAACAEDADAYYVLSFNAHAADKAHEYHVIDVKVNKPDTMVRTRTGYYAEP